MVSRGLEDHASFATQAARQAGHVATAYRHVLGCELVAAVRADGCDAVDLADLPVREAFELAVEVLDPDLTDRPLSDDIADATAVLDSLADV